MERENQHKRAREGDDEEYQYCSKKIYAEKQDSSKGVDLNDVNDDKDSEKTSCDSSLALDEGVFDFPWLKDGMISKSEDWKLDDTFSSSLYDTSSTNEAGIDEFPAGQCLCQTPEPAVLLNKPDDHEEKFDDNLRRPQEDDGLGCIWTSLLSEPLQQGGI